MVQFLNTPIKLVISLALATTFAHQAQSAYSHWIVFIVAGRPKDTRIAILGLVAADSEATANFTMKALDTIVTVQT